MKNTILIVLIITTMVINCYAGVSEPYTPDAYTLHLYHFDGDGNDEVTTNPLDLTLSYGATATETSYPDFGTALNTYEGTSGTDYMPTARNSREDISEFIGADGAFTFEAIVKPAVAISVIPNNMQIIAGEDDDDYRGWQFRVTTAGLLEFIKLTGTMESFSTALPTSGDHAWAVNEWFHAAVTYNGSENTTGNLKFYWTALDSDASEAILLGSFQMTDDLTDTEIDFSVGNEDRNASSENFEGMLDEARISSIARAANEMIIVAGGTPRAVIITHPSDTTVQETQTAQFQTVFESESAPVVTWFKLDPLGDIELNPSDPDITTDVTYDSGSERYTATLSIANTSALDAGEYYCQVNNDSGSPRNSDIANLTVQGPVAHWTLDQSRYDGTFYLEEINGYDATVAGTAVFVTGVDGTANGAALITYTDGWALAPVFDPVEQSGQISVSFWVNWNESQGTQQDIWAESTQEEELLMQNGLVANDQWRHVCTVFDGTNGKLYVDGVLQDQGSWQLPADTEAAVNIGVSNDEQNPFNGAMDDVRIYNYALTDTEVADVYYAMSGQSACILSYASQYDLSGPSGIPDCVIDIHDLRVLAQQWLSSYDLSDFAGFADNWLSCGLYPDCQ